MTLKSQIILCRHGETAWSLSGRHTGFTDLPLTERGRSQAEELGKTIRGTNFAHVFTSPLLRARETCEIAGFGPRAVIEPDIVEWNYGAYEGLTHPEIDRLNPCWNLFRDGVPGGETPQQISARADRVIEKLKKLSGPTLLFSHGHFLRVLAARWLGLPPEGAKYFVLAVASLSVLGFEKKQPVIQRWNS